jgi:hypothetical protein
MKDSDEVLLPTRNLVLIRFGEDESVEPVPFTLFHHLPLDLGHGSEIKSPVSSSLDVRITSLAHVFSIPIASRTDWLSWSNRFPCNFL